MPDLHGSSVPPPGWQEGKSGTGYMPAAASPLIQPAAAVAEPFASVGQPMVPVAEPVVATAQPPAEAAIRWRIGAAVIDNILVYLAYLLLCLVVHWRVLTLDHLLVLLVMGVVYHFALESNGGQTIGKRRYGIQVVSIHGGPATQKGIALRSVLRSIDALPFWYLSGLINMVRTGPERRQRIGDVAGETKVIAVGGLAATRGTPGWYLPAATLISLAISGFGVYGIVEAGSRPLTSAQQAEFVSECQNSTAGPVLNCQCFLSRLEADGYNTPNSLNALAQDARNEQFSGQSGTARSELETAAFYCHR